MGHLVSSRKETRSSAQEISAELAACVVGGQSRELVQAIKAALYEAPQVDADCQSSVTGVQFNGVQSPGAGP